MATKKKRCRLCASFSGKLQTVGTSLGSQIGLLLNVHINKTMDDRLPKTVCAKCASTVSTTWTFYNKVQRAQKKLSNTLEIITKNTDVHSKKEVARVQKVEEPDPQPHSYHGVNADNNVGNVLIKSEMEEYSDSNRDCPSEPTNDSDDPSYPMAEDLIDSVEFKPVYSEQVPQDQPAKEPQKCNTPKDTWPDYPWCCSICGDKCIDAVDYRNHHCFALHKRFVCVDCPKALSRRALFYAHVIEHHWERYRQHMLLQCDICHSWFNSQQEQEAHRGLEHPEVGPRPPPPVTKQPKNELQCKLCGTQCKTTSYFNLHMKKHTGVKPFVCEECGRRFLLKTALAVHEKTHTGIKDFTCNECGKGFTTKGNVLAHMVTHTDARLFSCAVCQKSFKTVKRLRDHQTLHSTDKTYVCSDCGLSFRHRGQLYTHARVHSETKKYECDLCDKSFKHKHLRDVHRRQHTGEQPYACITCGRRFTNYPNCSKHMRRVHDVKAPPSQCLIFP